MALRLAGEEFSVVQGLDGQGWLQRTIKALVIEMLLAELHLKDTTPTGNSGFRLIAADGVFTVKRADTGATLFTVSISNYAQIGDLWPLSSDAYALGTPSRLWSNLYVRRIQNPGAGDNGRVYIDDELETAGASFLNGNVTMGGASTGRGCLNVRMKNNNPSRSMVAGDVVVLDTSADDALKDSGTAGNESLAFVVVGGAAVGGDAAILGSGKALVNCDTGAVNRGDILVTSNLAAAKAMANNAQTDERKILGIALTAKTAGAEGQVAILRI